jgi:hypothetical protein
MHKITFCIFILFSNLLFAVKQESQLESYFSHTFNKIPNSSINPDNSILKSANHDSQVDLRLDYRLSNDTSYTFILRPRFLVNYKSFEINKQTSTTSTGKLDLTDLFLEKYFLDNLKLVTGLQVYQWGPAEFFNPTNPVYKTNAGQRNSYFKEKGKVLLRFNYDPNAVWSMIFLTEFLNNNEPSFMADTNFEKKYLAKIETTSLSPNSYLGLVLGQIENSEFFFGEYGSFQFFEAYSFYFDIKHPKGNKYYRPQKNFTDSYDMQLSNTTREERFYTFADIGLRYEGSIDFRLEYIYQSYGYTLEEFQQAKQSSQTLSLQTADNIKRFYKTGLDLYGKEYLYLSLRVPDLGKKNDMTIFFRNLNSLMDSSKSYQFSLEKNLLDSLVLNFDLTHNQGDKDSELTLLYESSVFAGLKWSL